MARFRDRLAHAWNAFSTDQTQRRMRSYDGDYGGYYGTRQDRPRYFASNDRSIVTSIYTRMSVDVSMLDFKHCRLDKKKRYLEDINSDLNECLTLQANIDQIAPHLFRDIVHTMVDAGNVAIVPVDTSINPEQSAGYDIQTMRVGTIVQWHPRHVRVNVYNDRRGVREDILLQKEVVGIVENPFYTVMNEENSMLKRLTRKLALLDKSDEMSASGKLDIIIQLPYQVKGETRRQQAAERVKDIEFQLTNAQYGIAYADATEKITQLNRPVENNLLKQIEFLTTLVFGQLGLTPEIMNGTADEEAMLNYLDRTIGPIAEAICLEMKRKFLSKTARTQGQSIEYFRDPFKLIPLSEIAEIADKMTRNEVLTSNEIRQGMGYAPSQDPKADELRNSNMPQSELGTEAPAEGGDGGDPFAEVNKMIDEAFADLGVEE